MTQTKTERDKTEVTPAEGLNTFQSWNEESKSRVLASVTIATEKLARSIRRADTELLCDIALSVGKFNPSTIAVCRAIEGRNFDGDISQIARRTFGVEAKISSLVTLQ